MTTIAYMESGVVHRGDLRRGDKDLWSLHDRGQSWSFDPHRAIRVWTITHDTTHVGWTKYYDVFHDKHTWRRTSSRLPERAIEVLRSHFSRGPALNELVEHIQTFSRPIRTYYSWGKDYDGRDVILLERDGQTIRRLGWIKGAGESWIVRVGNNALSSNQEVPIHVFPHTLTADVKSSQEAWGLANFFLEAVGFQPIPCSEVIP